MAKTRPHFYYHRREAQITRRRFVLANLAILSLLTIVVAFSLQQTSRADIQDVQVILENISPGNGASVRPGDIITYHASYRNNGPRIYDPSPEWEVAFEAAVPPGTTLASIEPIGSSGFPYGKRSEGFNTDPTPHDPVYFPHAYWPVSELPEYGAPYSAWTFQYQVRVNNVANGTQLCAHADVRWGGSPGTSTSGTTCNTVSVPPPPPPVTPATPPPAPPVRPTTPPPPPVTRPPTNPVPAPIVSTIGPQPKVNTAPDTQPPSVPGEFTAKADNAAVILGWIESQDNTGVSHYRVERSTDQKDWSTIGDDITQSNYSDQNAAFNTHYYYRVRAYDASGNGSDFALADIQTKAFAANSTANGETTVTSDDGRVTVVIPSDALEGESACSLLPDEGQSAANRGKMIVLAGPYSLVCRKASGDAIDHYLKPVKLTVALTQPEVKKYGGLNIYQFEADKAPVKLKTKYDKKTRQFSFESDHPVQFAVLGSVKTNPWPLILSILIPIILLFAGAIFWRLRQIQKTQYNEYIRRKYYNL